jgi:uncharacterized protein with GYD domain
MPKYLIKANYTTEGIRGVAAKGGTARSEVVSKLIGDAGGTMECFYFAWGDTDAYIIGDLPSDEVMAGIALAVSASGSVTLTTTPLLTPAQIDSAAGSLPGYSPPGS